MREIKFRAWGRTPYSESPSMTKPFDFRQYVTYHEAAQERLLPTVGDDVIYMQYTGLKDKNGVEIYEGDITRFHTDEPTHWMQEADIAKGHVTKEVVWHEGKFHLNKDGDVLNWHVTSKPQNLEVIGNIYENPELLKEREDE